ncbi:response regulator, partial [Ferruginibacter sp.]|uniref:response regulator n=1 Tax=Ferruginibacter sp. TaxID=1940288 RepID=UPI0019BAE4F0
MQEKITTAKLDFLSGGGKMGELIRYKDWSKTPLGSPDTWPQSLRTTVSLCIASNFPIAIVWGPNRVQIYNDGYLPITGDMHPVSMGQDFKECWHSAWPVIGPAFEEASLGQARFLENQLIFLDRYGYKEETFFTFSFSPILDESGGVGGLFHPVIELTQQTLAERRLNVLRAVADSTISARTLDEATSLILECLKDFELDIPFVLLYSIAADGTEATLQGNVGVEKNSPLAPEKINLQEKQSGSWPIEEAIQNGTAIQVNELKKIFGHFSCGSYAEPPEQALVFPVTLHGTDRNDYFFVAGVSSRRSLDEKYRLFYELLAASVTNTLTKAKAYVDERKKAEALAEIDKAKTVFFSNISHEFRTPLTLMLSPLEELLNQKNNHFSKSEKQHIETAQRNAMRLLKLVNTLLDFSRIESGRQEALFNLVDIVALTKNLAANFRSVIEKAGLKLIIKADTIIQPVYVDRQMWEKIVFNLLSNAFKYTLTGSITVELSEEEGFAVLKVKDTGIGIPENELPKMFERFHRVQNVTGRTYEGTGIGLSLIKELVQMHQGTINVESKLNEGSIFTVKILTGKKHINEQQISKIRIDSYEISSAVYVDEIDTLLKTGKQKSSNTLDIKDKNILPTILVVDDNVDMREHISSILSNTFNVITANNGMDALHKIKENVPTLVLSDIMMPVMDGISLLKEIKSNKSTANIPVIFLTARAGEESKIEGLETGADDYLIKPFSSKELLARINTQINISKLRQSLEDNVRNLFMDAPAIICVVRGATHIYEFANV